MYLSVPRVPDFQFWLAIVTHFLAEVMVVRAITATDSPTASSTEVVPSIVSPELARMRTRRAEPSVRLKRKTWPPSAVFHGGRVMSMSAAEAVMRLSCCAVVRVVLVVRKLCVPSEPLLAPVAGVAQERVGPAATVSTLPMSPATGAGESLAAVMTPLAIVGLGIRPPRSPPTEPVAAIL